MSSSSLPQTPPDLPVEAPSATSLNDLSLIQAPAPPAPSHQHIHQHIYPSAPSTQEEQRDNWIILATG